MHILAIDPGDKYGVAEYEEGRVRVYQHKMLGRDPTGKKRQLPFALVGHVPRSPTAPRLLWDLLIIERPVPPGPKRSVLGTISLAMTAGVFIGAIPCEELCIVTPSSWNSKGRGEAAATRCLKKHGIKDCGPDAKSALGILLWKLKELGEDIHSLEVVA